jgi:hypothetical protein
MGHPENIRERALSGPDRPILEESVKKNKEYVSAWRYNNLNPFVLARMAVREAHGKCAAEGNDKTTEHVKGKRRPIVNVVVP